MKCGDSEKKKVFNCLRWLKTVLMDRYYRTFSVVSLKMVSKKYPIIAQQVVIIFP